MFTSRLSNRIIAALVIVGAPAAGPIEPIAMTRYEDRYDRRNDSLGPYPSDMVVNHDDR